MTETIHVVYCLDDGYAEPTSVSMASMLANTKSNVHFHVISNRLSDENKAKLSSLSESFSHGDWNFYQVDFDINGFILESTIHFTVETYYRFFIPKILPDLEKVIYIDGDTVIIGDISKLWNEYIEDGIIAGVVSDIRTEKFEERLKICGLKYYWHYFSAGVLLLKLKEFEKLYTLETLSATVIDLYKKFKNNNVYWYADQEVLNYLFNGEKYAKFLNLKYNLEDQNFNSYNYPYPYGQNHHLRELNDANNSPIVIHYAGPKKPWHLNNELMFSVHWRLYYKYKAFTPFYDPLDEKRIAEYDRREMFTKTESFIPTSLYIQWFWRDIFIHSAKCVKQVIGNRKLVYWGASKHITHIMVTFTSEGLYPDTVVDGLAVNWDEAVFEYTIQPAEILQGKAEEFFVVLCMETKQARDAVIKLLKEYGYDKNGFVHAYAEAYERENRPLL
jgi:lipopolysaccharide biosynthesis glycosyltransferase